MNVWFTSDLHLGHANICLYCNRPWLKDGDYDLEKKQGVSDELREARAAVALYVHCGIYSYRRRTEEQAV